MWQAVSFCLFYRLSRVELALKFSSRILVLFLPTSKKGRYQFGCWVFFVIYPIIPSFINRLVFFFWNVILSDWSNGIFIKMSLAILVWNRVFKLLNYYVLCVCTSFDRRNPTRQIIIFSIWCWMPFGQWVVGFICFEKPLNQNQHSFVYWFPLLQSSIVICVYKLHH